MSKQAFFMKLLSVSIIFVPKDVVDLKLSVRKVLTQVMDSNPSAGKGFFMSQNPFFKCTYVSYYLIVELKIA